MQKLDPHPADGAHGHASIAATKLGAILAGKPPAARASQPLRARVFLE
jgi:hypothetical protein